MATPEPVIPKPTYRDFVRVKRQFMEIGAELNLIRKKGFAAVASATDRVLFLGMYSAVDDLYLDLTAKWERALEIAEVITMDHPFPALEDHNSFREFKTAFYEIRSYHLQIQAKTDPTNLSNPFETSSVSSSRVVLASHAPRAMLPKIDIGSFHGDFTLWPSFKQLFTSIIKEEASLSNAERFYYLLSLLKGPALDTIKHLPPVAENFDQAWGLLVQTYDDPRKLACTYLERFLNYKPHPGKPTAESLQSYLANVTESIVSLRNLHIENLAEYLLCELALRSLDAHTREAFEISIVGTPYPQFQALQTFVQNRCHVLRLTQDFGGRAETSKASFRGMKPPNHYAPSPRQALMAQVVEPPCDLPTYANRICCFICQQRHKIIDCPRFRSASPESRLEMLKSFDGCRNCLYVGHRTNVCTSPFSCRLCNARHHTDLHLPQTAQTTVTDSPPNQDRNHLTPASGFAGASTDRRTGVLLGTVLAQLQDATGNLQTFRGVLDPGSQFSFLTEGCTRRLALTARPFKGAIAGVNGSRLHHTKGIVTVDFIPPASKPLRTEAVVVPSITPPLPQTALTSLGWAEYRTYPLSDPCFDQPGVISFLIGADLYPEVVTGRPLTVLSNAPHIMNTVFGFTILGRFIDGPTQDPAVVLMAHSDLTPLVERFWELEEPHCPIKQSPEEELCENLFCQTYHRSPDGRYIVRLPFKTPEPSLRPSTSRALNCLRSLELRLAKDPFLLSEYHQQINEYITLGHMSLAEEAPCYLLPHHAVVKEVGDLRKVRVVFDASFPTATGSLNDHLLTGPKLQADLPTILLNFRCHPFVFTCDIVKMFRQIWVDRSDRRYLQIAWRFHPSHPVKFYQLNTVTFGLSCSPYLAQRVLQQHALNYQQQYPKAAAIILQNTYIDDITGGADNVEDLHALKVQLVELLQRGGFALSKWNSNVPALIEEPNSGEAKDLWNPSDLPVSKILGMRWEPGPDTLLYDVHQPPAAFTKRSILSVIARLYDPLGYLAPAVFHAKCIFQHTWRSESSWDAEVSVDVKRIWKQFIDQLPALQNISIPRALPPHTNRPQLICFCDASAQGYCAAAYLRTANDSGATLTLLKAKTRLAPIKPLTIPRLELCGAVLLSQLVFSLEPLRQGLSIESTYCFTDSMTVLAWLRTEPYLLQVFVSNRVQQILNATEPSWWFHIKGSDNPADLGSRGTTPSKLKEQSLWWDGPEWMRDPVCRWPITDQVDLSDVPETKTATLSLSSTHVDRYLIDVAARHSRFLRLVRAWSYLNRFIHNSRLTDPGNRWTGPVTSEEFQQAEVSYIKVVQHFYFPEIFCRPFNELAVELRRLNVFLDVAGVIRVGGRLRNADISYEQKHPMLLPKRSAFTTLVVDYYHLRNHHAGPATLAAALQQRYWIPGVRNLIKAIKHKCVTCVRYSKSSVIPFMGDLPKSRFAADRPFLITGVDFAGPFVHRVSTLRNARTEKAYLCLFICMSSRAIHLEVATGLSVEAFLDAFERFVSRRGIPSEMLSDGGTNFRGSNRYLQEITNLINSAATQSDLIDRTAPRGVTWNFNPPSSPHFGGGWEVSIRMVKDLLGKTFGSQPFTLPELQTAFAKIEGILNSRPLQPASDSPEDLEALTPGHFLIGQPLTALPEPNFLDIPAGRLNRWQRVRERVQYFWDRWRQEYLATLQLRNKWDQQIPNLQVGDLVLVRDGSTSPAHWPLGRIQEVHPGQDNVVRVVTVRTPRGAYRRPAVKMIPLHLLDLHA